MARGATARYVVAKLCIAAMTQGCQFVLGTDATQCARDDDCPMGAVPLRCVDGLCVEGEVDDPTSDVATDGSTGLDVACEPATECLPTAPPGWDGPVIAMWGEREAAPCPPSAPMLAETGYKGLNADPPVCMCECPEGDEKPSCDVRIHGVFGECGEANDIAFDLIEDVCRSISLVDWLGPAGHGLFPQRFEQCAPTVDVEEIPAIEWDQHLTLCKAPAAGCETGVCLPVPDPLRAAACIWQRGDVEDPCPDAYSQEKYVFHEDWSDERRCSQCTCGEPSRCWLEVFADLACSGEHSYATELDVEHCVPKDEFLERGDGDIGVMVSKYEASAAACEATGGVPTGTARGINPFTVCCRA